MPWRDVTSYSQRETGRTPRVWEIEVSELTLTVHRHIHHGPDVWLATCPPLLDGEPLPEKDIDVCKPLAAQMVADKLREMADAFAEVAKAPTNR